jgi:hypothetical protein
MVRVVSTASTASMDIEVDLDASSHLQMLRKPRQQFRRVRHRQRIHNTHRLTHAAQPADGPAGGDEEADALGL